MIQNRPKRVKIGEQNGIGIYKRLTGKTKLKTKTPINQKSQKQKYIDSEWHKNVQQKCIDLDFTCQWCGKKGLPTKAGLSRNCLTGHHIIKRRFGIHTYENVYICHWNCHDWIETHNIKVERYPALKDWENRDAKSD